MWSQSDVDALIEADKKAGGDYGRTQVRWNTKNFCCVSSDSAV